MSNKKQMPTSIALIFEQLELRLLEIHARWKMYRHLFGHSRQRCDLLRETAEDFFGHLRYIMYDHMILEICRISEATRTGQHKNFVISQISSRLVAKQNCQLIQELNRLEGEVQRSTSVMRDRRNERIAHLKLASMLDPEGSPVPEVPRAMIEEALKVLRDYMNTVAEHFGNGPTGYAQYEELFNAEVLVHSLKKADAYSALELEDWTRRQAVELGRWKDA